MANGELVPLVNFRSPVNENNRSVAFQMVFSASPFYVDFRTLTGSDMAGTSFRPFGVMIDNTLGNGNLQISFSDTSYRMICKKGEMLNLPYPAGPYTVASIVGDGQATVIFVDYPVEPYSSSLEPIVMPTAWGQITGTLSNQIDLQNALDGKVDKIPGKGLSTNDFTNADKSRLDGLSFPSFSASKSVDALAVPLGVQKVTFQTIEFNNGGGYDAANSRFIVPAGAGGIYYIGAHISWQSGINQNLSLRVFKNGAQARVIGFSGVPFSITATTNGATMETLAPGDIIEIYVRSDLVGPYTIYASGGTRFFGYRITP